MPDYWINGKAPVLGAREKDVGIVILPEIGGGENSYEPDKIESIDYSHEHLLSAPTVLWIWAIRGV